MTVGLLPILGSPEQTPREHGVPFAIGGEAKERRKKGRKQAGGKASARQKRLFWTVNRFVFSLLLLLCSSLFTFLLWKTFLFGTRSVPVVLKTGLCATSICCQTHVASAVGVWSHDAKGLEQGFKKRKRQEGVPVLCLCLRMCCVCVCAYACVVVEGLSSPTHS